MAEPSGFRLTAGNGATTTGRPSGRSTTTACSKSRVPVKGKIIVKAKGTIAPLLLKPTLTDSTQGSAHVTNNTITCGTILGRRSVHDIDTYGTYYYVQNWFACDWPFLCLLRLDLFASAYLLHKQVHIFLNTQPGFSISAPAACKVWSAVSVHPRLLLSLQLVAVNRRRRKRAIIENNNDPCVATSRRPPPGLLPYVLRSIHCDVFRAFVCLFSPFRIF